ncbi:MAG: beta-glucosidase [Actinomycetota bacterium]|jgi:beta-glucosidase|nr:beta-glucosidase [Actinomycetota bacterium]
MSALDGSRFGFGVATASFQIEGASDADGRGESIWDRFCERPGAIADGSDGTTACGSYDRVDQDLDLVRDLGVDAYRFSIAWPRIQPDGSGPANTAGLDYYERVVDGLLGRDLVPLPTLYHWDLPQALEDAGGWPARDTVARFAEYAALVAERLGDRVRWWSTLNEPWCSAFLGYAAGIHAPGRRDGDGAFAAAHHLLLAHAVGADAVRSAVPAAQVGIVLNLAPVWPESDGAADGVAYVDAVQNGLWLGALVDGRYPSVLAPLADPALVREGDLARTAGSADWLGINYYTPFRIAAAGEGGSQLVQSTRAYPGAPPLRFLPREPMTEMGWEVDAAGMEDILLTTAKRAPGLPLMVTENGSAYADDDRAADGSVQDDDRIAYLHAHVAATQRARDAGADVRAYIAWTLLDNFEWSYGYTKKFGIVEVEAGTLRRVPKASYRAFAALVAEATR